MDFWTPEHVATLIPSFIFMLAASLLLRKLLIDKPYEIRMIPIKVIAVMLIILEVGKQTFSILNGYNVYHLPLHFCSIFIYALPLMAFYRGKVESGVRSVTCAAMLSLFIGMLIIPNVIYSDEKIIRYFDDYISFHSVSFHNLVIFALILVIMLELHTPSGKIGETAFITLFASAFVLCAATASHLLDTNFSNFLYSTVGIVYDLTEEIKLLLGESATTLIYTGSLAVLHVLLLIVTNYLFLLLCKSAKKIAKR